MNAIRRDESTDNIHSIFVDQWDWEKIIHKEDRNLETIKRDRYAPYITCLRKTEQYMAIQYDYIERDPSTGNLLYHLPGTGGSVPGQHTEGT